MTRPESLPKFRDIANLLVYRFQTDLLKTMLALEQVYINLGQEAVKRGENCVIIHDRGAMDASACTTCL